MAYFVILTDIGVAKFSAALAASSSLQITDMVLGDGAGSPITPLATWTSLTNQIWQGTINRVYQSPDEVDVFVAEGQVPKTDGGWTIREVGLLDGAGDLIAVGSFPERYKPLESEGAYEDTYIRAEFKQSNTSTVTIVDNPSAVMATRQYVDESAASIMNSHHPYYLYLALGILPKFPMGNEKKLTISPPAAGASYGKELSMSASGKHVAVYGSKTIHVLTRGNDGVYVVQDTIVQANITYGPIKISGDGRTIAKCDNNVSPDSVDIYYKNSAGIWSLQQRISNPGAFAFFAEDIELSATGRKLIINSIIEDDGAVISAGAVYVFERDDAGVWTQSQRIVADTPIAGEGFGSSLALSADESTLAIGAKYHDGTLTGQGAVYVLTLNSGAYGSETQLILATPGTSDELGDSVSLSATGDTLLACASGDAADKGAAIIFDRDGAGVWTENTALVGADSVAGDQIGLKCKISANGKVALIASELADVGANNWQGAGYLFQCDSAGTWSQEVKLIASDGAADDRFGVRIEMSADANLVLMGAYKANVGGNSIQGAMYSYHRI